jgi:hypothetical protein
VSLEISSNMPECTKRRDQSWNGGPDIVKADERKNVGVFDLAPDASFMLQPLIK